MENRNYGNYVIQLENIEDENGFILYDSYDMTNNYEIYYSGRNCVCELKDEKRANFIKDFLKMLEEKGAIVDYENNDIRFTNEFFANFAKEYLDALKKSLESISPIELLTYDFKESLDNLKKSLMPLANLRVVSDTFGYSDTTFDSFVGDFFKYMNENDKANPNDIVLKVIGVFEL